MMPIQLGARWDCSDQDERFFQAKDLGLLDFIEVNYPIALNEVPQAIGLPILAHTSNNPLCSSFGIDTAVASQVRAGVQCSNYPWVGEHLAWLNMEPSGSLGYVVSPFFLKDYVKVAVDNIHFLQDYYGSKIALELGPVYGQSGEFESEMHFLGEVAEAADALIILDVTHWQISNLNLKRDKMYGLTALNPERIIELHIAGMRASSDGNYWHDSHAHMPTQEVLGMVQDNLKNSFPRLKVVTLEHSADAPETDFYASLKAIRSILN